MRGDAELQLQGAQVFAQAVAQLGVEVGERFVEEQHIGLDDDGAGERHALLLAARQLLGRRAAC